jgi:hypothetical protein
VGTSFLNGIGASVIRRRGDDAHQDQITFRPKRFPIGKPITLGHFSTASAKSRHGYPDWDGSNRTFAASAAHVAPTN